MSECDTVFLVLFYDISIAGGRVPPVQSALRICTLNDSVCLLQYNC